MLTLGTEPPNPVKMLIWRLSTAPRRRILDGGDVYYDSLTQPVKREGVTAVLGLSAASSVFYGIISYPHNLQWDLSIVTVQAKRHEPGTSIHYISDFKRRPSRRRFGRMPCLCLVLVAHARDGGVGTVFYQSTACYKLCLRPPCLCRDIARLLKPDPCPVPQIYASYTPHRFRYPARIISCRPRFYLSPSPSTTRF